MIKKSGAGKSESCVANFVWFMSKKAKYFDSYLFLKSQPLYQQTQTDISFKMEKLM